MHRGSGVRHSQLGFGIVTDQNPDQDGKIEVKFEDCSQPFRITLGVLKLWPTDMNWRIIKVGDLIIYPVKGTSCGGATIGQGIVIDIKKGPKKFSGLINKLTIKEDKTGLGKSHSWPEHCIVIDTPIIKRLHFAP